MRSVPPRGSGWVLLFPSLKLRPWLRIETHPHPHPSRAARPGTPDREVLLTSSPEAHAAFIVSSTCANLFVIPQQLNPRKALFETLSY